MDGDHRGGGVAIASALAGEKRKRRRSRSCSSSPSFDRASFPLMLAAISKLHNRRSRSIIKHLLRSHLALISKPLSLRRLVPNGLLALLPYLLASSFPPLVVLSAKVVSAVALHSLEANEMIASDEEVVKCLVHGALGSQTKRVVMAACNAVMDLSTSLVGRSQLRESNAIGRLLFLFCQVCSLPVNAVSHDHTEEISTNHFEWWFSSNDLSPLVLDAVLILINSLDEDCSGRIPELLVKKLLQLLICLWGKVHDSATSSGNALGPLFLHRTKTDLAAAIFRLAMNKSIELHSPDDVKISLFGSTESAFEKFILDYWEVSPLLFGRASENVSDHIIFGSLGRPFDPKTIDTFLPSILQGLISCPPIASDELDIYCFLNEVKGMLGSPIIYGQDIRVLRTQTVTDGPMMEGTKEEVHFFKELVDSEVIDGSFAQKCIEAFQNGYTIAVRGMEFRDHKVAAIADGLASLFGQPSAGANIYLTPPNSQGLAQHYDDHCVFVCQIYGRKSWRILPRTMDLFPRLYEPLQRLPNSEGDLSGVMQVLLEEGDILYIPRGYPHEAQTSVDQGESTFKEFSLHLTLGIEVEPPFEWEGFTHIALHCWKEKQKEALDHDSDSKFERLRLTLVILLHVSIRQIANSNPIFRKACMIAAFSLASNTEGANSLLMKQKATFCYILDKINVSSNFMEAFKIVETVVQERDIDSLQWMRWLQHLPQEGNESEKINFSYLLGVFEDIIASYSGHSKEAMLEFDCMKFNFCKDVVFEDACTMYILLLENYRRTRRQYMRGMLSLHSKYCWSLDCWRLMLLEEICI
ncbi:putative [histone H3]-dimethyl-L-lysine(36) demethylase [Dioscorea sansibarensis]